jgi:Flp pilus assembly protein TadG
MRKASGLVRNEKGAALALVAVSLVVILGMGAMAVDMGMLIKQREDAQRAADAAALAGASSFQEHEGVSAVDPAKERAFRLLAVNYVGSTYIDTSGKVPSVVNGDHFVSTSAEGTVIVVPDSDKVRVYVRRPAVGTFFARVLGVFNVSIGARAAAIASEAGAGKCVKPFAFPDFWSDADNDDLFPNRLQDLGPGQGKGGEHWQYDESAGDTYRVYDPDDLMGTETGLGSDFRNTSVAGGDNTNTRYYEDQGRPIVLKQSNPQQTSSAGYFLPWVIPGSNPGAQDYKKNIYTCNPAEINLTTDFNVDGTADTSSYDDKTGNMIGPTKQGMDSLINLDPDACWASMPDTDVSHVGGPYTTGQVMKMNPSTRQCDVPYSGWEASPRVAIVPVFDPGQMRSGKTSLRFNNLAMIFIEDQPSRHAAVVGRFMKYTRGTGDPGETNGSLVKIIRLVE